MAKDRDGAVPPLTCSLAKAQAEVSQQIEKGQQLLEEAKGIRQAAQLEAAQDDCHIWDRYNVTLLKQLCGGDYLYQQYRDHTARISAGEPPLSERIGDLKARLNTKVQRLRAIHGQLGLLALPDDMPGAAAQAAAVSRRVFIIHGRDMQAALELKQLLAEEFPSLEPLVLSQDAWEGRTIIEKFEQAATECGFAFAVFTPDDLVQTEDGGYAQMRPNVLFELGWFHGRLGRDRTCILYREGTAIPSDLQGLGWCKFGETVDQAYRQIKKELRAAYGDGIV